jgi:hypothetical protein
MRVENQETVCWKLALESFTFASSVLVLTTGGSTVPNPHLLMKTDGKTFQPELIQLGACPEKTIAWITKVRKKLGRCLSLKLVNAFGVKFKLRNCPKLVKLDK